MQAPHNNPTTFTKFLTATLTLFKMGLFGAAHSWFNFNNLGLVLGMTLKFYSSVAKGLKLKVEKFSGIIPMFGEVIGEKLVGSTFYPSSPDSE